MVNVTVAVALSIGIPLSVALFVFIYFWYNLQKRFKKEEIRDMELEKDIFDETDGFQLDFPNTWKTNGYTFHTEKLQNEDSSSSVNLQPNYCLAEDKPISQLRLSKIYIPAYRKKIKSIYIEEQFKTNNVEPVRFNIDSSSTPIQYKKRESVYHQILPFMNVNSNNKSMQNLAEHSSTNSNDYYDKRQSDRLVKSLTKQDFGSYYPR